MTISHCRDCGIIMSNDVRELDEYIDKDKIYCKKCRAKYKKRKIE